VHWDDIVVGMPVVVTPPNGVEPGQTGPALSGRVTAKFPTGDVEITLPGGETRVYRCEQLELGPGEGSSSPP